MVRYRDDECVLLQAVLDKIRKELNRCYWNKNQKEMNSPFDNTGQIYENDVFTVRAYNWDTNIKPNFEYGDLKIWWYKHSNRCTYAECVDRLTFDDLTQMLQECMRSIQDDFGGNNGQ